MTVILLFFIIIFRLFYLFNMSCLLEILAECIESYVVSYINNPLLMSLISYLFPNCELPKEVSSISEFVNKNYEWLPEMDSFLEFVYKFNSKSNYLEYFLFIHVMNLIRDTKDHVSKYITKIYIISDEKDPHIIIHFADQFNGTLSIQPKGIKVRLLIENIFKGKFVEVLFICQRNVWKTYPIFKKIYSIKFYLEIKSLKDAICTLDVFQTLYELYTITENNEYTFIKRNLYEEKLRILGKETSFNPLVCEYVVLEYNREHCSYKHIGTVDKLLKKDGRKHDVRFIEGKDKVKRACVQQASSEETSLLKKRKYSSNEKIVRFNLDVVI